MKTHHWRATIFSCKFILSDFMSFWFLIALFQFNYWYDSWIFIAIYGYIWWFEIVSFNWLLEFLFIKTLDIYCVLFYGYIWWIGLNWISFVICAKNGFIEWFNDFLKYSRTYIRFVWWKLRMCIDEHENMLLWFGGCGLQNLSTFCFVLFYLCFYFIYQNQIVLELG
jgi:hypothetical protein